MPAAGRPVKAAVARALDSFLGHVADHDREDIADPYLVRVSARAWKDLGESPPATEPPPAAKLPRIVTKFYKEYSNAARVDNGVPIGQASDPKVFRIKSGDWRAAVKYLADDGVVWMCRALSLAKFQVEDDAYEEFGNIESAGTLLPNAKERRLARGDQFLMSAIQALRQARVNADNEPFEWWPANARRPNGDERYVGRIYVDREPVEEDGAYVTRFLLVVTAPPDDVKLRPDWEELVAARVFPSKERVFRSYELPGGTNLQPGEVPYQQQTVELIDEAERDDPWR
jgi:hypothetical protein